MSQESTLNEEALETLKKALQDLKFGSVEVTVHDGKIVQIERREKQRFPIDSAGKEKHERKGGRS